MYIRRAPLKLNSAFPLHAKNNGYRQKTAARVFVYLHGAVGPVGPVGPVAPAAPVGPVGPVAPAAPVGPVGPVGPVAPVAPVGPVGPVAPVAPPEYAQLPPDRLTPFHLSADRETGTQ